MSDDLPLTTHSDAQILRALKLEASGLRKAIAAIEEAGQAMDAAHGPHASRDPVVQTQQRRAQRVRHGK